MTYDKLASEASRRRVPESVLLLLAFSGGAYGFLFSMYILRHKTRKKKFTVLVPVFAAMQTAAALYLLIRFS